MAVLEEVTASPAPLIQAHQAPAGACSLRHLPVGFRWVAMMEQGWLSLQCSHTPALRAAEGAGQAMRVEGWEAWHQEEREQREVLLF